MGLEGRGVDQICRVDLLVAIDRCGSSLIRDFLNMK